MGHGQSCEPASRRRRDPQPRLRPADSKPDHDDGPLRQAAAPSRVPFDTRRRQRSFGEFYLGPDTKGTCAADAAAGAVKVGSLQNADLKIRVEIAVKKGPLSKGSRAVQALGPI